MEFNIPRPLKLEHEELHAVLARGTKEGGSTGAEARSVAEVLHPHFEKEEEFALPPLGLLAQLAEGKVIPEMEFALRMTERLKAELRQMMEEHKAIANALEGLSDAADKEGKAEYIDFSKKLILHAQTEEEVLYPAAILIGEYLKLKLNR